MNMQKDFDTWNEVEKWIAYFPGVLYHELHKPQLFSRTGPAARVSCGVWYLTQGTDAEPAVYSHGINSTRVPSPLVASGVDKMGGKKVLRKVTGYARGFSRVMVSTDNFENSFRNFLENLWREVTEPVSYESLINGYHLANKHDSFSEQAGTFLFSALNKIVTALGRRLGLRSDRNQNNILARAIERIGGNYKSRSLFERAEVSEGKWNKNNVSAVISGHTPNPDYYSRTQAMTPQASERRGLQWIDRSVSAIVQAIAADFQVLISLLLAQFESKTNFAYTGSIPQDIL